MRPPADGRGKAGGSPAVAASLIAAALLAGQAPAQDPPRAAIPLPVEQRRGADAGERTAVSDGHLLDRARAGVWDWGPFRIVVAEDAFNCHPSGHCPFSLLNGSGVVILDGTALERPSTAGQSLVWTEPDGSVMRATPAP